MKNFNNVFFEGAVYTYFLISVDVFFEGGIYIYIFVFE